jgi:hypothetical protein
MLGEAPLRYRDGSPRRLRLYRAAVGEPSHAETLEDHEQAKAAGRDKPWGVEVLGRGNQFLAIGCHPTGTFLEWTDERNLFTTPRDDLAAITEAQVVDFLSVAGELLGAKKPRQNQQNGRTRRPFLAVLAVLARVTVTQTLPMSRPCSP